MSEITNEQIYKLLLTMQADLVDVKERVDGIDKRLDRLETKVDTIQNHVAEIDERVTQTEKVKNIFRPEVFEA